MYVRDDEAVEEAPKKRGRPPKKSGGGTISKRRERIPMGTARLRFQREPIPGFRQYGFREENVQAALRAGYQFVRRDRTVDPWHPEEAGDRPEASGLDVVEHGRNADGSVTRTYIMAIPQQFYEEDKAAKAREHEELLNAKSREVEDGQYKPNFRDRLGSEPQEVDF